MRRLARWLEPVVEFGEVNIEGTWADDHQYLLMVIAVVVALAGIVAAYLVYQRHRVKAIEPTILANGWYYDQAVTDFMGGPGYEAFEGAAWFDRNVIDGAVNGTGRARARHRRRAAQGPERLRARLRRDHRRRRRAVLLAWFVVAGVRLMRRRPVPDPHRDRARAGGRRGRRGAHAATAGPTSCKLVGLLAAVITGALSDLAARRRSTPATPASSSCPSTRGSSSGASRGTSASTASRCSSSCSPACCSRSPSSAPIPHHDEKPYLAWMLLLEAGVMGSLPQPRPVPVLRLLRDRARADVLPHRRLGLRQPRLRGHASSSCSRCSARRSCSSASSPPCSSPATTASARSRSTSP